MKPELTDDDNAQVPPDQIVANVDEEEKLEVFEDDDGAPLPPGMIADQICATFEAAKPEPELISHDDSPDQVVVNVNEEEELEGGVKDDDAAPLPQETIADQISASRQAKKLEARRLINEVFGNDEIPANTANRGIVVLVLDGDGVSSSAANQTTTSVTISTSPPNDCIQDYVEINWGHTEGDGSWACDEWVPNCGKMGGCLAVGDGEVIRNYSKWDCYLKNCTGGPIPPSIPNNCYQGDVDIDWGHTEKDGYWACNENISSCRNSVCFAVGDGEVMENYSVWTCYLVDCNR
ncbi:hypothetical protein ACHAW5_000734 [Stephanodiscus triporus]|uniref:Uncharacterized protein n=1 Tax=Stephanodiscus triporus TaxID=2934178 RepID=A0ABD3P205_9STRA